MAFQPKKAALAYSGGLDTSIIIPWLRETYGCQVVAICGDIGQGPGELDGIVEVMPESGLIGMWQVSGRAVQVTETTAIDQEMGALAVGVAVEVEGMAQPDGSILATEIEVEDADDL